MELVEGIIRLAEEKRNSSTVKYLYLSNNERQTESSKHNNRLIITGVFFLMVKGPVSNTHKTKNKTTKEAITAQNVQSYFTSHEDC